MKKFLVSLMASAFVLTSSFAFAQADKPGAPVGSTSPTVTSPVNPTAKPTSEDKAKAKKVEKDEKKLEKDQKKLEKDKQDTTKDPVKK
jgi:Skp family chaperone for outer membrane proteins